MAGFLFFGGWGVASLLFMILFVYSNYNCVFALSRFIPYDISSRHALYLLLRTAILIHSKSAYMKLVTPKYDALNRIVETGVVTDTEDVFATLSESNAAQQIDGETFAILLSSGIKAEVTQTYYDEPLALNTPPTVPLAQ